VRWSRERHRIGERTKETLRVHFDARVRLEFHGATLSWDAGLLECRELDDTLGLTRAATRHLEERRRGLLKTRLCEW
jgi:hypothetical protein